MATNRLERKQKNIGIITTSMFFGVAMCLGFGWVLFQIMAL